MARTSRRQSKAARRTGDGLPSRIVRYCCQKFEGAIGENQPEEICRAAHTLRSMLLFFEAATASDSALCLETMGRDMNLAGLLRPSSGVLSAEVERIVLTLTAHRGPNSP